MMDSLKTDKEKKITETVAQAKKRMYLNLKRPTVQLFYEGVDVTPKHLNLDFVDSEKESQWSNMSSGSITILATVDTRIVKHSTTSYRTATKSSFDKIILDVEGPSQIVSIPYEDRPFKFVDKEGTIPTTVRLVLTETETIFLLDIASTTTIRGTDEGDLVEADNRHYEYITQGKGKNRKLFDVGVQTAPRLLKSRSTNTTDTIVHSQGTFVSNWEMYDTYNAPPQAPVPKRTVEDDKFVELSESFMSAGSSQNSAYEEKLLALARNPRFRNAALVIERILASNCYNEGQKRFRNWIQPDFLAKYIEYTYKLELLWSFTNERIQGRCISCMEWNHANSDILAVGYGMVHYEGKEPPGFVLIWNIKNPTQPERWREFSSTVSCLAFSVLNPNIVAVGFYNGKMKVLDVNSKDLDVFVETSYDTSPNVDPLWGLTWHTNDGGKEDILAVFENGRVYKYEFDATSITGYQIMRTAKVEGSLPGIQRAAIVCHAKGVGITQFTSGTTISLHPTDDYVFFVGTGQGILFQCSLNYFGRYTQALKICDGPVAFIKFSPLVNKVYLSAGIDGYCRMWVLTITEPLITSAPSLQPINDCDWSPSHSTVMASVRGDNILIFDICGIMKPRSVTRNPCKQTYTTVRFSNNGSCLAAGDIDGNVHVYALENVPRPPFFQENFLFHHLPKVADSAVRDKLKNIGSLNSKKAEFKKYFN